MVYIIIKVNLGDPETPVRLWWKFRITTESKAHDIISSIITLMKLRQLYPPIKLYNAGKLKVSNLHEMYYEE